VNSRDDRFCPHDDEQIYVAALVEPPVEEPEKIRKRRISRWMTVALLVVVLGPVAWRWWPKEVARWYSALATERQLDGDAAAAEQALTAALWWDPESAALFRQRGDLFTDQGQYERALEDYCRALELNPEDTANRFKRSIALQYLGRHAEAVEDWLQIKATLEGRGQAAFAWALNGLAYARALGSTDLDRALEEVNQALQFGSRSPEVRAAMLDTRGYIQVLRGEYEAARADLDRAIDSMEVILAAATGFKSHPDAREHQQDLERLKHHVAVMVYHRALLFEQLGEDELAARDLRRVRRLGHEPGERLF
jgi:tetratricopeptide (TPR) repeat protein